MLLIRCPTASDKSVVSDSVVTVRSVTYAIVIVQPTTLCCRVKVKCSAVVSTGLTTLEGCVQVCLQLTSR